MDRLVAVAGGELNVAVYRPPPPDGPTAVAVHGLTASSRSFAAVAEHLPQSIGLLAVDLRGRGASTATGPFGIEAHTHDLLTTLDHFELPAAIIAGHSMGAYVAATFGERFPDRTDRLVLIDGGFPLTVPPDTDPDAVIEAVVGPALARLSMTFDSVESYFAFWRAHPAIGPYWNETLETYLRYDLIGQPPELRSRVLEAAVRADGRQLVVDHTVTDAVERVTRPMLLVRVNKGLMDEPGGLVPEHVATAAAARNPHLSVATLDGPNHYTLLMGEGAVAVARAIAHGTTVAVTS